MKKICTKCKEEKELIEFHKDKNSKDGYRYICKLCKIKYIEENKEKIREYQDELNEIRKIKYNEDTEYREKILERNRKYREENREELYIKHKEYREENKEELNKKKKVYRDEHKEETKEWWKNNPDKVKVYRDNYKKSEKCKQHRKNWYKKMKEENPHIIAWRTLLNNTLKRIGSKKEGKTIDILGYSAIELKEHIEKLFTEDMSWNNYGEWHIDHIKPVSTFDKNDDIKVINNLNNLRPLWASENCSRKNNIF